MLPGQADLRLPDIASVGVHHRFSERWSGLVQYNWFNWSRFDEIEIELPTGNEVLPQNYRDSYAVAVGAEYRLDPRWTLRGGIQYDRTPTRLDGRSTRTPDGDRTWLSLGASYAASDRFSVDLAYSYIDVAREEIDITRSFNGVPVRMQGTTDGDVHVLAAALRYHF